MTREGFSSVLTRGGLVAAYTHIVLALNWIYVKGVQPTLVLTSNSVFFSPLMLILPSRCLHLYLGFGEI